MRYESLVWTWRTLGVDECVSCALSIDLISSARSRESKSVNLLEGVELFCRPLAGTVGRPRGAGGGSGLGELSSALLSSALRLCECLRKTWSRLLR